MMRSLMVVLIVGVISGCGSGVSETGPVAGVPLAINNPVGAETLQKPNVESSIANPAVTQLAEKAKASIGAGKRAAAIEALSQAIGIDPQNSSLFRMRADVYSQMGEDANARADLSLAISCDSGNAELYNVRGYFLMTRGAVADALVDFNKALELNPEFAAAYNNRGLVHLATQTFEKALADFDQAVKLDRNYPDALNNRGYLQMKIGDVDLALADLQATVKLKPDYTTAWNNCGLIYMQQEKYSAAIEAFSEAVRLAPYDARWLSHRRAVYQKMELFAEANADAQRLEWIAGLNLLTQKANAGAGIADVWKARAEHLLRGGEYAAAVQDFSRGLRIEPANTDLLNGRALALLNSGDIQSAIADCDVSLVTEPSTTAFSIRGDAWFALRNYNQAIQDFEAGQKFDDTVAEAYRKRAESRRASGENAAAEQDLKRAEEIEAALAGKLHDESKSGKPLPFPEQ